MATKKKKTRVKAKTRAKVVAKKTAAKKKTVAKKTSPRKAAKKKAPGADPFPPMKPMEQTQQMAIAEIVGDIEERMALDRLADRAGE